MGNRRYFCWLSSQRCCTHWGSDSYLEGVYSWFSLACSDVLILTWRKGLWDSWNHTLHIGLLLPQLLAPDNQIHLLRGRNREACERIGWIFLYCSWGWHLYLSFASKVNTFAIVSNNGYHCCTPGINLPTNQLNLSRGCSLLFSLP